MSLKACGETLKIKKLKIIFDMEPFDPRPSLGGFVVESGTRTGISQSTLGLTSHHQFTIAPYSIITQAT